MNDLFSLLRSSGSGCIIGSYYAGCFGYADDLFFLCPSRTGLQKMLSIAERYVKDHNISFSTNPDASKSKTKGIVFSKRPLKYNPVPLRLDGNPLPWVMTAKYLGNDIDNIPAGLSRDVKRKRAMFIERNLEINQEFPFAHPELKCKLNRIYNSAFPGSTLYDLTSHSVQKLVNSWSTSVRHMWELPFSAHKYLVEPLSGDHAFKMLITRHVKFIQSIRRSPKFAVQLMLSKVMGNVDTTTGKNVQYIQGVLGGNQDLFKVTGNWMKKNICFCRIEPNDQWKVNFIKEMTDIKHGVLYLDNAQDNFLSSDQLKILVDFVSSS